MAVKDGGPAFPLEHTHQCKSCHGGMSIRDYLICHIVVGLVARLQPFTIDDAKKAIEIADLVVEARNGG